MHGNNRDFYGHPPKRGLSLWLLVPAAAVLSLALAALWARSNYGANWRASQIAITQEGRIGP